jgi:hypothetical protein
VKKIGLIAGIIVVIAIAALLGYIAFRPQTFQTTGPGETPQTPGEKSQTGLTPQQLLEIVYSSIEQPTNFVEETQFGGSKIYSEKSSIEITNLKGREIKITSKVSKAITKEYFIYIYNSTKTWSLKRYDPWTGKGFYVEERQGFGLMIWFSITNKTIWELERAKVDIENYKPVTIEGKITSATLLRDPGQLIDGGVVKKYDAVLNIEVEKVTSS